MAQKYNTIRSKADTDLIDLESRLRRVEGRTLDLDTAARYLRLTLANIAYSGKLLIWKGKSDYRKEYSQKDWLICPRGVYEHRN